MTPEQIEAPLPGAEVDWDVDLLAGELEVIGRITVASNLTLLCRLAENYVAYKPIAGEQPLWDFPGGLLAHREMAAYLVSRELGVQIVPPTTVRSGQFGEGMVQLWCEPSPAAEVEPAVAVVERGQVPPGYCTVFDGVDPDDEPVTLIHHDSAPLRSMALFDAIINNADRKAGHILALGDRRLGIDHGISFHHQPKLRTVLWGWAGASLTDSELELLREFATKLDSDFGDELGQWLSPSDVVALNSRVTSLIEAETMPMPRPGSPTIPWPPF